MLGFFEPHAAESWSATKSDPSFTFSGTTCTGGGAGGTSYVTAFTAQRIFNNQKIYFEVYTVATNFGGSGGFGFGNPNASSTSYLGSDGNGLSWYFGQPTGYWSYNGGQVSNNLVSPNTADTQCYAIDGVNQKIWCRLNNGEWNADVIANQDPGNNIGGFSCPLPFSGQTYLSLGMVSDDLGESYRLICTPSGFLYTPPVGFRAPNSMATK